MNKGICLWCGGELPKRRRKYCCDEHAELYFVHKIAPLWWENARKAALLRANNCCEECGAEGKWPVKLEVHHIEKLEAGEAYHNSPKNRLDNLKVLC